MGGAGGCDPRLLCGSMARRDAAGREIRRPAPRSGRIGAAQDRICATRPRVGSCVTLHAGGAPRAQRLAMDANDPRSDEDLFRIYSDGGDCQALGVLFHRRSTELLRIAAFLAPRPTEAEDLVQATFLSAIAHADQFRRDGRVMSWLCGILTNHARMLRRTERRRAPEARDQVAEDPADAALRNELQAALGRSISELPEPYRSVVKLHLEGGLDSAEIGERLHRPAATVRKQIERALDRLRLALPLGLVAALTARVDAAALARNAADAAQFVARSPAPPVVGAKAQWAALRGGTRFGIGMLVGAAAVA
ncbi:MAG: RNA polymerase sigma factor, partial [Planctomycetota bacterium]